MPYNSNYRLENAFWIKFCEIIFENCRSENEWSA